MTLVLFGLTKRPFGDSLSFFLGILKQIQGGRVVAGGSCFFVVEWDRKKVS